MRNQNDNIELSAVEDHDGILTIRGGGARRDWNGIHYRQGMSAKNIGSRNLSANIATIPPRGVASAHIHVDFEVILYIIEGKVRHEFGPGLKQSIENQAGDFIFIKPGVPHEVFNMSDTEPVVFLRAVNVGGANRCQPAQIAKQLSIFGVVNIGAVGTFVVREDVRESVLRSAIARKLPFKCEIMICPADAVVDLVRRDPFSSHPAGANVTRFVNVLHKRLLAPPVFPLSLPSKDDWLLRIIAIQDRFVVGLYRRHMKAIGYLGKIEKLLGVPATNRNWNTIAKIAEVISQD